jgi:hypothetical protein
VKEQKLVVLAKEKVISYVSNKPLEKLNVKLYKKKKNLLIS